MHTARPRRHWAFPAVPGASLTEKRPHHSEGRWVPSRPCPHLWAAHPQHTAGSSREPETRDGQVAGWEEVAGRGTEGSGVQAGPFWSSLVRPEDREGDTGKSSPNRRTAGRGAGDPAEGASWPPGSNKSPTPGDQLRDETAWDQGPARPAPGAAPGLAAMPQGIQEGA